VVTLHDNRVIVGVIPCGYPNLVVAHRVALCVTSVIYMKNDSYRQGFDVIERKPASFGKRAYYSLSDKYFGSVRNPIF